MRFERPKRIVPDSWDKEKHLRLKRADRAAQRAAWKRRGREESLTPMPCPWRETPETPVVFRPAKVLAHFAGDLWLVRFTGGLEERAGIRLLRGGIPWVEWGPHLLRAYAGGLPVPEPFRPLRRLPPDWLEKAASWGVSDQKAFFEELRKQGLLPAAREITPEGVEAWLRWDEVRPRFMDFAG